MATDPSNSSLEEVNYNNDLQNSLEATYRSQTPRPDIPNVNDRLLVYRKVVGYLNQLIMAINDEDSTDFEIKEVVVSFPQRYLIYVAFHHLLTHCRIFYNFLRFVLILVINFFSNCQNFETYS